MLLWRRARVAAFTLERASVVTKLHRRQTVTASDASTGAVPSLFEVLEVDRLVEQRGWRIEQVEDLLGRAEEIARAVKSDSLLVGVMERLAWARRLAGDYEGQSRVLRGMLPLIESSDEVNKDRKRVVCLVNWALAKLRRRDDDVYSEWKELTKREFNSPLELAWRDASHNSDRIRLAVLAALDSMNSKSVTDNSREAIEDSVSLAGQQGLRVITLLCILQGDLSSMACDFAHSVQSFRTALDTETADNVDAQRLARMKLGVLLSHESSVRDFSESEIMLTEALKLTEQHYYGDDVYMADCLHMLANLYSAKGDGITAEGLYRSALSKLKGSSRQTAEEYRIFVQTTRSYASLLSKSEWNGRSRKDEANVVLGAISGAKMRCPRLDIATLNEESTIFDWHVSGFLPKLSLVEC